MEEPMKYRREVRVPYVGCDCFGRLKTSWLLGCIQEAASAHCHILGVGEPEYQGRRLFWVITRHRVQITRLPGPGETITVETWPCPTTKVAYPRSAVAYDSQGRELFRSISLWVLLDSETRAMLPPGKSGILVSGQLTGTELAPPGSLIPRQGEHTRSRTVEFSNLDVNGHMNNSQYLDWTADLLPSSFHRDHPAREFVICYLNEAMEGQKIDLNWKLENDLQVEARWTDPEDPSKSHRIFAARVTYGDLSP